jgi:hypothetical protein
MGQSEYVALAAAAAAAVQSYGGEARRHPQVARMSAGWREDVRIGRKKRNVRCFNGRLAASQDQRNNISCRSMPDGTKIFVYLLIFF